MVSAAVAAGCVNRGRRSCRCCTGVILKSADQAAVKRESPTPATSVGDALDLPRQRASYYLQELEKEGLVEFVEERRTGNCMERVLRATARHYLITPVVGDLAALTNGFLSKPA